MEAPPPPELPANIPMPDGMPDVPLPPIPLPTQASDRWKGVYWAPSTYLRGHLFVHAAAFLVLTWSLWAQPERYTLRTLQGLFFLIQWLSPDGWAVAFLAVALLKLVAGFAYPRLSVAAIVAGIVLLTVWTIGFAFAWLWDHATAIGFVGYALVLGEHFAALTMLDGRRRWQTRPSE